MFLRYFKQKAEEDKKNNKKVEKNVKDDEEDEALGKSSLDVFEKRSRRDRFLPKLLTSMRLWFSSYGEHSGFKPLRLASRFHVFSRRYRVNVSPKRKNFVPFSNSACIV